MFTTLDGRPVYTAPSIRSTRPSPHGPVSSVHHHHPSPRIRSTLCQMQTSLAMLALEAAARMASFSLAVEALNLSPDVMYHPVRPKRGSARNGKRTGSTWWGVESGLVRKRSSRLKLGTKSLCPGEALPGLNRSSPPEPFGHSPLAVRCRTHASDPDAPSECVTLGSRAAECGSAPHHRTALLL